MTTVPTATAARRPTARTARPVPLLVVGIVLFLGSELMFFSSLFGMYFTLRAHTQPWTPEDVKVDLTRLFFTSVLVASSLRSARVHFAALRQRIEHLSPVPVHVPPVRLCTDNGAMIAAAAYWHFRSGERARLDLDAIPNLPLA